MNAASVRAALKVTSVEEDIPLPRLAGAFYRFLTRLIDSEDSWFKRQVLRTVRGYILLIVENMK